MGWSSDPSIKSTEFIISFSLYSTGCSRRRKGDWREGKRDGGKKKRGRTEIRKEEREREGGEEEKISGGKNFAED